MNKKGFFKLLGLCAGLSLAVGAGVAVYTGGAMQVTADEVKDEITASLLTATSTTYTDFSEVSATSDARYAGNSAKTSSGGIQLRSKNSNSGIVSTVSGGTVKSVTITVESGSNTIDVYGSNTAYTAASNLYGNSKGTKVGSVTSTGTVTFTDDYSYVGIRSNSGALYLSKVEINWDVPSSKNVTSISVADISNRSWHVGDTVAANDLQVTVNYSEGDPDVITDGTGVYFDSDHTKTVSNALVLGDNNIVVYYTGDYGGANNSAQPLVVNATAALELLSIEVQTAPTKTTYTEGDHFDPTGLEITRHYTGDNSDTYSYANHTSEFTFDPLITAELATTNDKVTITYGGKECEQAITVNERHGTSDRPYTVAEARAAIDANSGITDVYATGIVFRIATAYSTQYKNVSFDLSDDGAETTSFLQAFRCKSGEVTIDSAESVQIGDLVLVHGNLKKYVKDDVTTYEFDANCTLESLTRTELSSITISGYTTSYYVGDTFAFDGTCTANFTDSSSKTVTPTSVSSPDMSTAGEKTITVTYSQGGISKSTTYIINVQSRTLVSISVATTPTDTNYVAGEYFDPSGLVITTVWNAGSNGSVAYEDNSNDFTFEPALDTPLTKDDSSVTITYGGKSTSQAITVVEVDRFELITSEDGLSAGAKYVIGNASGTKFMSTTQNSNNRGAYTLLGSIKNDIVSYETGMEVIELGGSTGAWTLKATNPDKNASGNDGYLFAAGGTGNSNYLRTQPTSTNWSITFNGGTPTMLSAEANNNNLKYNSNNDIFSCYGSGQTAIALYKLIDTTESIAISKNSISGLKTDTNSDNPVSITANNFTPTDIEVAYSNEGVATITKGTIADGIIPLVISFDGVGETIATITVKGGTEDYDIDLEISVTAKPQSIVVSGNGITNGTLEMATGDSKTFSKTHVAVLDTDEQEYPIDGIGDIAITSSDTSIVSISGTGTLNGVAVGTATVTFAVKDLPSVTTSIAVTVANDYKTTVKTITFNENLTATQGEQVDVDAVFASKDANTYFGKTQSIETSELLFSYGDRDSAVSQAMFSYDFTHGNLVENDDTHRVQTIYVYVTFDENYAGISFEITIEQGDDPLTEITLTNAGIVNDEIDIERGGSLQLTWSLTPPNPTDGRNLQFSVDDKDEEVIIDVDENGLITVDEHSGLGTASILVEAKHNTKIYTYLYVNVSLEAMDYDIRIPASYTKIISSSELVSGDYLIVYESSDSEGIVMDGGASTIDTANSKITGVAINDGIISTSDALDGATFHYDATATTLYSSSGKYMGRTGDSNGIDTSDTVEYTNTITFDENGNAHIVGSDNAVLRYNPSNNNNRFRYFKSSTYSAQQPVCLYLKSGGSSVKNVDATLFNAIHNNFGDGLTYQWRDTCENFDGTNWLKAGASITSITDYDSYQLNCAVADMNGNEIEQFLAKYDIIIGKMGTQYDFLGRFDNGGINANQLISNQTMSFLSNDTSSTMVIIVVSMLSISAVGGYLFLRRRNEQ